MISFFVIDIEHTPLSAACGPMTCLTARSPGLGCSSQHAQGNFLGGALSPLHILALAASGAGTPRAARPLISGDVQ